MAFIVKKKREPSLFGWVEGRAPLADNYSFGWICEPAEQKSALHLNAAAIVRWMEASCVQSTNSRSYMSVCVKRLKGLAANLPFVLIDASKPWKIPSTSVNNDNVSPSRAWQKSYFFFLLHFIWKSLLKQRDLEKLLSFPQPGAGDLETTSNNFAPSAVH